MEHNSCIPYIFYHRHNDEPYIFYFNMEMSWEYPHGFMFLTEGAHGAWVFNTVRID